MKRIFRFTLIFERYSRDLLNTYLHQVKDFSCFSIPATELFVDHKKRLGRTWDRTLLIAALFDKAHNIPVFHRLLFQQVPSLLLTHPSIRSLKVLLYIPNSIAANDNAATVQGIVSKLSQSNKKAHF